MPFTGRAPYDKMQREITMDNDITVRNNLQESDISRVVELHRSIYEKEFQYGASFVKYVDESFRAFFPRYDAEKDRAWICEDEGKLVGFLLLIHHSEESVQLRYFILNPEYRGRGVGNTLLDGFISFMKEKNYKHAFLFTTAELTAAGHLYTKYGFTRSEQFYSDRFGKPVLEQRFDLRL